jgi:hypothetical protein
MLLAATPAFAGVSIHIGIPAPPSIVIEAPPRLVIVPGAPVVRYAPDVSYNYFAYGDRYYTYSDGGWFVSPSYGGPWTYVERHRVPRPLLVVPRSYYRVPPGHAYRTGYHGHPHGMPPGQAKKYYGWRGGGYDHDHGHHGHHGHGDD